ncbi:MAG: Fic family protein [Chitinophagaceae bacterium]|nr:Fic family protein [Chitinophagaceae bacterium]
MTNKGMKFAAIIKDARIANKMLVRELAQALDIDASLMSRIESGERMPAGDLLPKLADELRLELPLLKREWLAARLMRELEEYPELAEEVASMVMERVEAYIPQQRGTPDELAEDVAHLNQLRKEVSARQPLDETQLTRLREFFHTRYTYHSNKIEGNTLTLQETALVVAKGITIAGKSVREHLEAVNHQEAVEYLEGLVQKGSRLSEGLIKELHYLILKGIEKRWAGVYRQVEVRISGSEHVPPPHFDVPMEMQRMLAYYQENRHKLHPVLLAADMHLMLVGIHPFMDGNGRTSRLLMNLILMQGGFYIANIKGDLTDRLEYYEALEEAHVRGNTLPFRRLVAKAVGQNMEEYLTLL